MLLENQVAIITGGTRGIGLATVKEFLAEGARVILCGSRQETADKAVASILAENPDAKVTGIAPDLTSLASVKEAFRQVKESYGRIDILVNNAGISDTVLLPDYTEEHFDQIMDLNIKGTFNCCQAVVETMQEQRKGVILNTSSMVSLYGQQRGIAYPTSKFAVNGLTLSLARELGPKGIRVNAVAPGVTETDMVKAVPKKFLEPMIAQIPLRRLGQPEDIANAFVFLASDKASYITGVVLSVDGQARN